MSYLKRGNTPQEVRYRKRTRNTFIAFMSLVALFICSWLTLGRHTVTTLLFAAAMAMPVVMIILNRAKPKV